VKVRLSAAAFNHLDLWTLAGLPGLELTMPHILAVTVLVWSLRR